MLTWPAILAPSSGAYAPFVRSLSGGQSLSGFEQVQPQLHDRWSAAFTFQVCGQATQLALSSLLARLRGRSNTVGLPDFRRVAPPRSASTPGSPLGTSVSNPPFESLTHPLGAPVGTSVVNPLFERIAFVFGPPAGTSILNPPFEQLALDAPLTAVNPAFSERWPDLAGSPYEFSSLAGILGTATVEGAQRIRFTPTAGSPAVGQYITISGVPRLISDILVSGLDLILAVDPGFTTAADVYVAASVSGTATIEGPQRVRFTPSGAAPAVGQYVTISGVRRRIEALTVAGADSILTVDPGFASAPADQYAALSVTGTASIESNTTVRFTPGGTAPVAGQYVTLLGTRRRISGVVIDGADRILTVDPGFAAAATDLYSALGSVTGTALIEASNRVRFTPSGAQPAAGQ